MAARLRTPGPDIRTIIDTLSDDALLDDTQVASLAGVSRSTYKRWRREGKGPAVINLNGLPRSRVGDLRLWLRTGRK
jgi:hypothetical protein